MSTNTGGGGTPTKAQDADANTKIQVEESEDENKIRFDTAGSERMIIDDTGQVGIGTSSPGFPLDIKDDTEITSFTDLSEAVVNIESTSDGQVYGPTLKLYRNSPTSGDSDRIGMIRFTANAFAGFNANAGPTQEHEYARIWAQVNDVTGNTEDATLNLEAILNGANVGRLSIGQDITVNGNLSNSDFIVHGQGVYALVVDASANKVGIGTNSPSEELDVDGNIIASGNMTCVALTQTSMASLKKNIANITKTKAKVIPFKEYNFKSGDTTRKRYGVVVEDIENDYPELVYDLGNGVKAVNYIDLLVKRVAEMEKELTELTGAKGDKGDTGDTGPQGPQGPAGADGANGKNGNSHLDNVTSMEIDKKTGHLIVSIGKQNYRFAPVEE